MSAIRPEIPPELLDAPVSDLDVVTIATRLTRWEELSAFLGLTHQDESDIRHTYPYYSDQKREALRKWRKIKGKAATFRAFIAAATSISDIELVDSVKDMLRASQQPPRNGAPADVRVDQVNPRRDRRTAEVMLSECILHISAPLKQDPVNRTQFPLVHRWLSVAQTMHEAIYVLMTLNTVCGQQTPVAKVLKYAEYSCLL